MTPNPESEPPGMSDDLPGRTFAQENQTVYSAQTNIAGDVDVSGGVLNTGVIDTGGGAFVGGDQYIGFTATEVITLIAEVRRQDQPSVWDGRRPYLGLTAFHEADAPFFFGREALVTDLLKRVQQARFVCIAGPSGSGKSSLAQAGLLHALRQGKLPGSEQWLLGDMTPKGNPIEQLARVMARLAQSPTAAQYLRENGLNDPLALHVQVDTLLSSDPRQRCVLLVDQFEELFTQTKDEGVRRAFIELLTKAAQVEEGRTIILVALRSDFISPCARYATLRACMNQQFQLVGAMEPRELALAITLPALEVGATLDPDLVARVIADMKGAPSALPLMQFALKDLFDATAATPGKSLTLTLTDYLKRGGVDQALQNHADTVFTRLTTEEQQAARTIFTKLIEVGQGTVDTRRTALISELVSTAQPEARVLNVVNTLAGEKAWLLTTNVPDAEQELSRATNAAELLASAQRTVTIAHEKLIDAWPWLRRLVDENRELIALQSAIREDARAWGESGEEESFLYGGARLARTIEQVEDMGIDLDALSARFIEASVGRQRAAEKVQMAARQREVKRLRQIIGGVLIVLVVMSVAAYFLYKQSGEISIQNKQLEEKTKAAIRQSQVNLARQLTTQAQTTPSELSLLISIEAVRAMQAAETRLPEVEGALRWAVHDAPMALFAHDGTVGSIRRCSLAPTAAGWLQPAGMDRGQYG